MRHAKKSVQFVMLCLLVLPFFGRGQAVPVDPESNLEELAQTLQEYDPIFIRVFVADERHWRNELQALQNSLPIERIQQDGRLRNDRIVISFDLRKRDDRGSPDLPNWRRWHVHERYRLEYEWDGGRINRVQCLEATVRQRAPWGFWHPRSEEESRHGCLELGPATILF